MRLKFCFLTIILGVLIMGCSDVEKFSNNFEIHRGVNLSHWLSQSDLRGNEREEYITEKDIEIIAKLGFDHIRLPIDEMHLWNETGEREDDTFALMHNAINWAMNKGLRVIIDLHVLRSHHFNIPDSRKLWDDKESQQNFINFWRELSGELKKYPNNVVAYEPLNEAVSDNPEDWNNLINWVIEEIRKLEPERPIIMGSNNWQMVGSFKDLRVPENDENIILSFHYYEPFLLSHYRAYWTPIKDLNVSVNYPGDIIIEEEINKLNDELKKVVNTHHLKFDKNLIEEEILQAVKVAKKFDLKLYCGEFGCFPTTEIEKRVRWYKDLIQVFDKYTIAWAHWNYKNDFPVVDDELKAIPEIMNVLIPHNI